MQLFVMYYLTSLPLATVYIAVPTAVATYIGNCHFSAMWWGVCSGSIYVMTEGSDTMLCSGLFWQGCYKLRSSLCDMFLSWSARFLLCIIVLHIKLSGSQRWQSTCECERQGYMLPDWGWSCSMNVVRLTGRLQISKPLTLASYLYTTFYKIC